MKAVTTMTDCCPPAPATAATTATTTALDDARLARLARALAHPARVHIVRVLLARRSCVGCDLVDAVGLAQSTVSEHLRILKEADVISGAIAHPRICYSLVPGALAPLGALLAEVEAQQAAGVWPATAG
ncbi:MAG: metalloregulator ArsR/SmtB family transcription factor [Gammaproteobacteria bacterium]